MSDARFQQDAVAGGLVGNRNSDARTIHRSSEAQRSIETVARLGEIEEPDILETRKP